MANKLEPVVHIGKDGITPNVETHVEQSLTAHQLIKARVLETCVLSPREAAEQLSAATNSAVVQVIGTKFVLYRPDPKEPLI
jgi:RNA-binding protein